MAVGLNGGRRTAAQALVACWLAALWPAGVAAAGRQASPPPAPAALRLATAETGAARPSPSLPDPTREVVPPFQWPPPTRLSYQLRGHYRGWVDGTAQVQWLPHGPRYEVLLDVGVGPAFAPLVARRMSSQGAITADGLQPTLYRERTRFLVFSRERIVRLGPEGVVLADGTRVPGPPGVQDTASQFVQLTWLLATQPRLLQPGASVAVPLALPHRLAPWVFEVVAQEWLDTPLGPLPTWYLRPRPGNQGPRDLAVEIWIAPTLQHLPVRLRVRQDAETFIDLMLAAPPQRLSPPSVPAPSPPKTLSGASP